MPREGTIRIPDREAMDRVTDLQQLWDRLEEEMTYSRGLLADRGARNAGYALYEAWLAVDVKLYDLGLLGDTAELATYENDEEV